MFSFVDDVVLDPFCGTGTTMVAAMKHHRHSIGIEVDRQYCKKAAQRLKTESSDLFITADLIFEKTEFEVKKELVVKEDADLYKVRSSRKKSVQQFDGSNATRRSAC